jgi:porphobilinogen synthase
MFRSQRGDFPMVRLRRMRTHAWTRRLVAEHNVSVDDLIWPIFIFDSPTATESISSLPGVQRLGLDPLRRAANSAAELGIPAIAIFPSTHPALKNPDASEAVNPDNLVCRAIRAVKAEVGHAVGVICDVALDPYSSHGHDGLVRDGYVQNDETIELLCQQAIIQVEAGCDAIAPSDMMDGRIGAIRKSLESLGYRETLIISYAAKYASSFYGPFRHAVGSEANLGFGDKMAYQQDPANGDEALHEVALDLREGADVVMVKPGLPYLDIIHRVKSSFLVPVFAYQVSGEYAMITAAAQRGWVNLDSALLECLLSFKRAGADGIFTYFAPQVAQLLRNNG